MAKEKKIKKANYEGNEISKLIKLIIIVTVIFLVFYAITYFINKKDEQKEETSTSKIQYDEILIGNLLTQPNDDYYVIIYAEDDYNKVVYDAYLSMYSKKDDALRYYTATLNNPFNEIFKSDEANFEISKITDLKLTGSTLIKVSDKKIQKYYEGEDIIEHLKEISKEDE